MTDLREKIESVLHENVREGIIGDYEELADRILAIPALKRMAERDNCPDCIRCGNCQDAPPLNPRP